MGHITRWADAKPVEAVPGLTRRTLNETADMMVVEFRSEAKVTTPLHTHPSQQIGYVVSGEIEITIEGVTRTCKAGDTYAVAGGVEHGAYFVLESVVVDCFSPPREDYR
ncbi:MAG: cupin domain-containing protein [Anaerolineae bacterium]|nr:cupin domain-containing protein [Anaerolineae bacterium]